MILRFIWNELAGEDDDFVAILVTFNSILQMGFYASYAIFYIDVVPACTGPPSPKAVSYSVVAQAIAIFLGSSIAYTNLMSTVCLYLAQ